MGVVGVFVVSAVSAVLVVSVRSRYQKVQTRSSDNTTITTQYFGKVYEKIKQNTNTEHKRFIYLDKQLIAIH
jgi:membrane protein implicated in regulation of membrane protease activity